MVDRLTAKARGRARGEHWTPQGRRIQTLQVRILAGLTIIDRQTRGILSDVSQDTDIIRDLLREMDELITELELQL